MKTFLKRLNYKAISTDNHFHTYECKISEGEKTLFSEYNYYFKLELLLKHQDKSLQKHLFKELLSYTYLHQICLKHPST